MEQGRTRRAPAAGPGNKTIATTLLELLAVRGRAGARERALRALGLPDGALAEAPAWLDGDALDRFFAAVDLDAGLARALGHRLCAPDATGLPLYGLGLATPEKAVGHGQERGNSGVFLQGRYEIQVLDSYDNKTYFDGQAAALYKQQPPMVNVCRKPGVSTFTSFDCSSNRGAVKTMS